MIFEEVVLHNFGAYRGEHTIPLEVSAEQPVVLIGAMNGSGKTTFLDAMQLALYGKSARCTGRERISYSDYLAAMINRDTAQDIGAAVQFAFKTRINGQNATVRVKRNWFLRGHSIKEHLEVERDEVLDTVASERWQEFVEDFMPSQIADLFFFDGEKIEALADPMRSATLLRVGVHSLLGIDLVESLLKSLQQVERKRKVGSADGISQQALDALTEQRNNLMSAIASKRDKLASLRTSGDLIEQRMEAAKQHFRRVGGELYERHDQLVREKDTLRRRERELTETLLHLTADVLPLAISLPLIHQAVDSAKRDQLAKNQSRVIEIIEQRDRALLKFLANEQAQVALVTNVCNYLERDRASRTASAKSTFVYPDEAVEQFRPEQVQEAKIRAAGILGELESVKEALLVAERNLVAIPDESVVELAKTQVESIRGDLATNAAQIAMIEEELSDLERKYDSICQQIDRESNRLHEMQIGQETSERVITHSVRARDTLSSFRQRLLANNLERLETTIRWCFQKLLRKQSLVSRVLINPESFELSVQHSGGTILPAHRLSAGERQLLAVATLWALSKASGRHLPAVIDTPLSRLDSAHRRTVVQNYFPAASHQVILLSTDEEVVGRYYDMLKDHIGRKYLITHYDSLGSSVFVPDQYFQPRDHREVETT